jgi:hypothetical protein
MTGEELLWIQAVEQLLPKMNKVFGDDNPLYATRSVLTSLANKVRGCSRELARIGMPSARLQPVYALVKRACQEYDNGAKCFEDAARIDAPIGEAAARKQGQKIQCGYDASGKGGKLLADAQIKASEIKAATG